MCIKKPLSLIEFILFYLQTETYCMCVIKHAFTYSIKPFLKCLLAVVFCCDAIVLSRCKRSCA